MAVHEVGSSILLGSGTNEVEIVEFCIHKAILGINVVKVREIIMPIPPVEIPLSHPCMEGIIQLRGSVIPVIDLAKFLQLSPSENLAQDKFIITEFNQRKYAFHVHDVQRIHRLSWTRIEKPTDVDLSQQNFVTGYVRFEDKMLLLLDFEHIVMEITPEQDDYKQKIQELGNRPKSDKKIIVAEDSPILRKILQDYIPKLGYPQTKFFQNGQEAWDYLETVVRENGEDYHKAVDLLITDIEMPVMDGHYLTKSIKEHPVLRDLPVVIFSSLITDDLRHKGESVGANAQISKPEHQQLALVIDELLSEEDSVGMMAH
ncbi:MAG: chemotaxis protein [Peptococcaceae bacterium]|nr:chemotaxis protein [Peptococcaceae bacterium]